MKIQFVRGFKLCDNDNFNYVRYNLGFHTEISIGMFMDRYTMHFRYKNKPDLKRIADKNESFIFVVIQDNPVETFKTLIHELIHFTIFKLFRNSEKLHNLIDRIDNPLI